VGDGRTGAEAFVIGVRVNEQQPRLLWHARHPTVSGAEIGGQT
jgi:hypothetical protein